MHHHPYKDSQVYQQCKCMNSVFLYIKLNFYRKKKYPFCLFSKHIYKLTAFRQRDEYPDLIQFIYS